MLNSHVLEEKEISGGLEVIYAGVLAGGTGSRMGITDHANNFWIWVDVIFYHTVEKFLLVHEIQKDCIGNSSDWVTYTEDLVGQILGFL